MLQKPSRYCRCKESNSLKDDSAISDYFIAAVLPFRNDKLSYPEVHFQTMDKDLLLCYILENNLYKILYL